MLVALGAFAVRAALIGDAPQVDGHDGASEGEIFHAAVDEGIIGASGSIPRAAGVAALFRADHEIAAGGGRQVHVKIGVAGFLFTEQNGFGGGADMAFADGSQGRPVIEAAQFHG